MWYRDLSNCINYWTIRFDSAIAGYKMFTNYNWTEQNQYQDYWAFQSINIWTKWIYSVFISLFRDKSKIFQSRVILFRKNHVQKKIRNPGININLSRRTGWLKNTCPNLPIFMMLSVAVLLNKMSWNWLFSSQNITYILVNTGNWFH